MYCHKSAPHSCDLHAERVGLTADGNDGGRLSGVDAIHVTSLSLMARNLIEARRVKIFMQQPAGNRT
jgi:hypothetical protein